MTHRVADARRGEGELFELAFHFARQPLNLSLDRTGIYRSPRPPRVGRVKNFGTGSLEPIGGAHELVVGAVLRDRSWLIPVLAVCRGEQFVVAHSGALCGKAVARINETQLDNRTVCGFRVTAQLGFPGFASIICKNYC